MDFHHLPDFPATTGKSPSVPLRLTCEHNPWGRLGRLSASHTGVLPEYDGPNTHSNPWPSRCHVIVILPMI